VDRLKLELRRLCQSSLAHNAGWLFMGQGLSIVCQAVYFILVGHLLGSAEYGIYVGAVAMVSILSQYSPLGSHSVFLRYVSPEPRNFALFWGNVLVTTITLGSIFVVLLTFLGPYFAPSFSREMLFCVALGDCLCAQLTIAAGRVFQTFERTRLTAAVNLMINILRTMLAGLMLWRFHHGSALQWAVAALIVSSIATCTALIMVASIYGRPAFSMSLLRRRIGEGFVFALSYSTTGVYNDVDKALLGHYGMNAANGVYTMAYRVVDAGTMPVISVQGAAFPRFFRKGVDGIQSTTEYSIRIVKRTASLGLSSAIAMLLAAPLIPHLLGNGFSQSAQALRWLCPLPFFRSFQLSAGDALTGAGHQKLRLGSQAAAALFNLGINLYLIPHYSWRGAAWSSLATDGLLAVFNWTALLWLNSGGALQRTDSCTEPL